MKIADAMRVRPGEVYEGKGGLREVVRVTEHEVVWRRPGKTKESTAWCSTWAEFMATAWLLPKVK